MVWTWAGWEPLQYYRRLGGFHENQEGNALWQDDWARQLRSREAARCLREAGINWVTTHFFKGFGLKAEAEEIAQTAELIRNYHAEGLRVFSYIQYGTIMPETLCLEESGAEKWKRVDWHGHHDGGPYEYGEQYWRVKPCANQDGFRQYLLRCVDQAVGIGTDGVWIDNLQADGCHCDACQQAFQKFLAATVIDPWREMGVRDLSRVAIPRVELSRDPVFHAWVRFRAAETKTSIDLIARHARALKPDVRVAANFGLGSHMRILAGGGNWVGNYPDLDYIYSENHLFPAWKDGEIVSQHEPMKLGAAIGVGVVPGAMKEMGATGPYGLPGVPDGAQLRRVFAESLLFGAGVSNGPWGLRGENGGDRPAYLRDAALREETRALADAAASLHRELAGSIDAAPVAILHSFEASGFDEEASRQAGHAMSQLLLQNQIPFRYVLSDRLEGLEGVRLLVLPHVLGMSDALAAALRRFVKRGGRILATGRSSLYDASLRMRDDYALAEAFGVRFSNAFEAENQDALVRDDATGCVLLPGEWGLADREGKPFCRVAPERIVQAIRHAVGREALPEVLSPLPHVLFEMRRLRNGSHLLGLVNYADAPVRSLRIVLHGAFAGKKMRVVDTTTGASLRPERDGRTVLCLPRLDVEFLAVVAPSRVPSLPASLEAAGQLS